MLDLTSSAAGYAAVLLFVIAYALVISEEFTHLRKSKPVVIAASILWIMAAVVYAQHGQTQSIHDQVKHVLLEYGELLLFLLVAMTYVSTLDELRVFDALRSWLVRSGFSFRQLFLITGTLAFFISPVADNLTTALVMCAVVLAVGANSARFVALSCINIVVAANAGGAFSPFGDITTLMVWQKGVVPFESFFRLFLPSLVTYAVPALLMYRSVPADRPQAVGGVTVMKPGAVMVLVAFAMTIVITVLLHTYLHLPPVIGMMMGLGGLQLIGYFLKAVHHRRGHEIPFDVFRKMADIEWDTLLFFYGVMLCVGALGAFGYLGLLSGYMYGELGASTANVLIGLLSSILDNIPLMFAVLTMNPDMSQGQWLLVTLTAGVGGSLLSVGSAAGVALMGQARGNYTFMSHLRWTPAILAGYVAGIAVHMVLNAGMF